jgi:ketosteroid isomerase-like protein
MKITSTFIVLLCCLTTVAARQQGDPSPLSRTDLHRLSQQWKQAYNSKDSKNLVPLYAMDAEYISAHVPGCVARGRDAVIANFQAGIDTGGFIDSIDVLSTHASCDLVTLVTRYRGTAGGQKVDGNWLIVTHMTAVKDHKRSQKQATQSLRTPIYRGEAI